MPLKKSPTKKSLLENIRELYHSLRKKGYSKKKAKEMAFAAAKDTQRKAKAKNK